MADRPKVISVDQLPEDPSQMPPPYWRSGGVVFQLEDALQTLLQFLRELVPVHAVVEDQLVIHFEQFENEEESQTEEALGAFAEICDPLWEIEFKVQLKCQLTILMAAIYAEELINRFCVYNAPKELVETLEKLSPAEKLTAAAGHLGNCRVRATAAFSAMTALSGWRNAFAHGHCVDRPVKTLRHNHLIEPEDRQGVPDMVRDAIQHLSGLIRIIEYLAASSRNPYTMGMSDRDGFVTFVRELKRFKFSVRGAAYSLAFAGPVPNFA